MTHLTHDSFYRINNDVNGNPRYVVHFFALLGEQHIRSTGLYEFAVKRANTIGGRKYRSKQYGGGIVFQSYCLDELITAIKRVREA